jgi:hypothetical protein
MGVFDETEAGSFGYLKEESSVGDFGFQLRVGITNLRFSKSEVRYG